MKAKQPTQPNEDDVLRRMLSSPPKPHETKAAPAKKPRTKKKP